MVGACRPQEKSAAGAQTSLQAKNNSLGNFAVACVNTRGRCASRAQLETVEADIINREGKQDMIFILEADFKRPQAPTETGASSGASAAAVLVGDS